MSSTYRGSVLTLSIFGQSHAPAIGMTLDGLPAGFRLDQATLFDFLARRAPGQGPYATARREKDQPEFLGGLVNDTTCGAPLAAIIRNGDHHSGDYGNLKRIPRPAHADFAAQIKYGGFQDVAGGGHFSGRLTAPLCIAGGVCLQMLAAQGITVVSHILSIGFARDSAFDPVNPELPHGGAFPVLDPAAAEEMQREIAAAKAEGDSVGGVIECAVLGVPAGLGDPIFDGLEPRMAQLLFSIPAVKGVEFGAGFAAAAMRGSEHNDSFTVREAEKATEVTGSGRQKVTAPASPERQKVTASAQTALDAERQKVTAGERQNLTNAPRIVTETNRHGGILGGISSGMPIVFRAAFKPTPSIARAQRSVDLPTMTETTLEIKGRHDPCIVPRAVPCVEAAAAIAILDALLAARKDHIFQEA